MKNRVLFLVVMLFSSWSYANEIHLDDVPVREWVRWYSDLSGESVSVAQSVSGRISVYRAVVPDHELPAFFRSMMRANGYEVSEGPPVTVLPGARDWSMPPIDGEGGLSLPSGFFSELDDADPDHTAELVQLRHVRASEVASVLQPVLSSVGPGTSRGSGVGVVPGSNSLLLTGTVEAVTHAKQLLPVLDVRSPQVLVRALFYELREGDSLDLGVAFGSASGASGLSSDVVGGFNTSQLGSALSVPGGSFGVLSGDVLSLALRAIQRDQSARLLSTPHVVTLSGREGRIAVGQEVPVVTGRLTGEAISADSPFQTIERRSVGLGLTVSPVVLSSGMVVMGVETRADSVASDQFAADLVTNERLIRSTVQLSPGETLVLGGLVSDESSDAATGVPGLSRLPLVGRLFQSSSESSERSTLHVMLTVEVIGG